MSKRAWIIFAVLVVGIFGYFLIVSNKKDNTGLGNANVSGDPKAIVVGDHQFGNSQSKVTLIEYLDPQCPGCGQLNPSMQQIMEEYKDKVHFVHRVFPLTDIHKNALAGSRALEAAGLQGKFFEMENVLFTNQSSWQSLSTAKAQEAFEGYAKQIGLDVEKYKTDYAGSQVFDAVSASRKRGEQMGVTGTPTLFINGEKITFQTADDIRKLLDDALAKNK